MVEYVKVWRQGGSLLITIPPSIRDEVGLAKGDQVALAVFDGQILVTRIQPGKDERKFLPHRAEK